MTNNLIRTVRAQFQTRGYVVDEIRNDTHGHSKFTVESDRDGTRRRHGHLYPHARQPGGRALDAGRRSLGHR